jgi:predicted HicB family RNase H-like nuclease
MTGCIDQGKDSPNTVYIIQGGETQEDTQQETPQEEIEAKEKETLPSNISSDMTLTADKYWIISGLVTVEAGATLKIEAGTTIAGQAGKGDNTSYLVVDKGAKIDAQGTSSSPIIFTSETALDGGTAAAGQWGGLTLIGKAANSQVGAYEANTNFVAEESDMADNSGVMKHVKILNTGIAIRENEEVNGLSFVGVGSGTTIEDITVENASDDGIELWGGTVNLSNITITNALDDSFDIDDGYSGTVKNLTITNLTGKAGIEMSGTTVATFDGFNITIGADQAKEGGIYFKKDGIGGYFSNGTITNNSTNDDGAIHSAGNFDAANTSFTNVKLLGSNTNKFTGDSAIGLEEKFDLGVGNVKEQGKETLVGEISSDTTLTKDTIWILNGLVSVTNGATLKIEAGTTIAGKAGKGDNTSYLVVDKGAKIDAQGTASAPIIFTSETALNGGNPAPGQWGGVTLIGKAANSQVGAYEANTNFVADDTNLGDSSGVMKHVKILNTGIAIRENEEVNGLSFVGVGSGTIVEDITVENASDDGIELWGGTVNLTNINITNALDDSFDIDDGYAGTVRNLTIDNTTGKAGIEMSGTTAATFDGFDITIGANQAKEGGIYFKKDGIGGYFSNGTITNNSTNDDGAIHSAGAFDTDRTSFNNVTLAGSNTNKFTGDSAAGLQAIFDAQEEAITPASTTLTGSITANTKLTASETWIIDGLVSVTNGATLTIEAGTTIAGKAGKGDNTSYLVIDKGAKIDAQGTSSEPITFTSETALNGATSAAGQWGGVTLIGKAANSQVGAYEANTNFVADETNPADNSGIMTHVKILNTGIAIRENEEVNGLSFVGVGSGTTVEDITVENASDDGIELWGGTVNLSNISISNALDDSFDIDDGYSGTVRNLTINNIEGKAGIEMSGTTAATFDGFNITIGADQAKEGGIYFKKDGIGGYFSNGTVTNNATNEHGAIHSAGAFDAERTSFTNVTLAGSSANKFTGDSAEGLKATFDAGSGNQQ